MTFLRHTETVTKDWHDRIASLTAILVGFLAVTSFVLSYEALLSFAKANGVNSSLAWLWPLTLDFFVIVASLTILNKSLKGRDSRYPWMLVIVFTILSILFNAVHKGLPFWWYNEHIRPIVPPLVYILPPVSLVLSFHLVMDQLQERLQRPVTQNQIVKRETMTQTESITVDKVERAGDTNQLTVTERRDKVLSLTRQGVEPPAIADRLEVSPRTIYRDIKAIDGKVNGHGNHDN